MDPFFDPLLGQTPNSGAFNLKKGPKKGYPKWAIFGSFWDPKMGHLSRK